MAQSLLMPCVISGGKPFACSTPRLGALRHTSSRRLAAPGHACQKLRRFEAAPGPARKSVAVHAWGNKSKTASHDDPEALVNQFYDSAQKGSKPDTALVNNLSSSLESQGSSFGPQQIANLVWAIAKTGTKLDPKILATIFGLISAKSHSFKPAQIAAVLWALGSLGQKVDSGTIAALGKAIAGQVSNFDPRSLTDALWGFAKLGGKLDGGTISKLAQRVKELASKFKPQEAANALWALVKLDQANGGNAMKAMLAIGAGGIAVNAVKGILGSDHDKDAGHAESSSKQDKKVNTKGNEDEVSKALDSLRKSGADPGVIKAMSEAAKNYSHDGHDSNAHLLDAVAALQKHGHDKPKEEHHSGGLFGLFGH